MKPLESNSNKIADCTDPKQTVQRIATVNSNPPAHSYAAETINKTGMVMAEPLRRNRRSSRMPPGGAGDTRALHQVPTIN